MATTSDHVDNKGNTNISDDDDKKKKEEENETNKLQSIPTGGIEENQGNKITEKADDLMQIGKTDTLSSIQSTNEDNKSDQTLSTSDTSTEKKNEEKTVETTDKKEESGSASVSSAPTIDNNIKKEETTTTVVTSDSGGEKSTSTVASSNPKNDDNAFPIEKGDAEHLTDFQRQKAKYFFNVNLDIENKEYVTWEDVEFYLLFHATAAGKEGSDGGDLEARLSRSTRAFWEHIHDQVPLPDNNRDKLTLDQFLDTWASLIDYVVRTGQLPPIVQDLVKLGFELYSTDGGDGKSPSIQISAFDQLFQKMNLGRPFAIMAYKAITENGTKPLDADKIDSIVRAVITSSDDEHTSHFLLPGFFKTITVNKKDEKNKTSSPVPDNKQSEDNDKPAPTATPPPATKPSQDESSPPPQQQQPNKPTSPPSEQQSGSSSQTEQVSSSQQQKPTEPKQPGSPSVSSQTQQANVPPSPSAQPQQSGAGKQHGSTSQGGLVQSPTPGPSTNQQLPQTTIQQEDESIRHLLRYYHIDDGDVVEVAGGSKQRLILVHPERPLPPYIQQNTQLLQKLQPGSTTVSSSSAQQNGFPVTSNNSNNNGNPTTTSEETKPKVTFAERVSRGEARKGPSVPFRQEPKQQSSFSIGARQVYPPLSEGQQKEQQRQAKLQATQPLTSNDETKATESKEEETSSVNNVSSSQQDETQEKKNWTHDDEEKLVAAVLKQLTPLIEKRVAAEVHRIQSGETDEDEDENFNPFQFMFAGGNPFFAAPPGGLSAEEFQEQRARLDASNQGQQQPNGPREADFGGLPPGGAAFLPPQLLMAMMSDLARGGAGGEIPGFPSNMPPPSRVPGGVEGFMMFVDDDQIMGGPPGYPPRPGPRF